MRLSPAEKTAIVRICQSAAGEDFEALYLHGSRADATLRGGDIDLILVVRKAGKRTIDSRLHYLLADLKIAIGEQRIDIIVATKDDLTSDPFLCDAMQKAMRLDGTEAKT